MSETALRERGVLVDEAQDRLLTLQGRRVTLDIRALPADLHLPSGPRGKLVTPAGHGGSYEYGKRTLVLAPTTPVVVRQTRVYVKCVLEYLQDLREGGVLPEVQVTDRPGDGQWWHLNGAHRLIAARLCGLPIEAAVWI